MQLQVSTEPFGDDCVENGTTEECLYGGEDKTVDVIIQTDGAHSNSDFSDQELKGPGGSVMDILNWARPLPALLSPVQLSPLSTQVSFKMYLTWHYLGHIITAKIMILYSWAFFIFLSINISYLCTERLSV